MKITHRVLADEVRAANTTVMLGFPFGFRVPAPDSSGRYSLYLVYRVFNSQPSVLLCVGTPREVLSALKAIIILLPLGKAAMGGAMADAIDGLVCCSSWLDEYEGRDDERALFYAIHAAQKAAVAFRKESPP